MSEAITGEDIELLRAFSRVVCPKLRDVLVPFDARSENWDYAAERFAAIADYLEPVANSPTEGER